MPEHDDHEVLDPTLAAIVTMARRPVALGDAARARIELAIQAEAASGRPGRRHGWAWALEPRALRLSPLGAMAMAAGLVGIGIAMGLVGQARTLLVPRTATSAAITPSTVAPTLGAADPATSAVGGSTPSGVPVVSAGNRAQVKFVLFAPGASQVTVVGDFNRWSPTAHPMQRTQTGGTWTITVPLGAGRHEYSFVVDGKHWMPDPAAPLAADDGFGVANSVLLVSGSTS